jgi:hypothetical protein
MVEEKNVFRFFAYIPLPTFSKQITEEHVSVNLREKFLPKSPMTFRLNNGKTTILEAGYFFYFPQPPPSFCNICYNPGYDTCQGESWGGGGGGFRRRINKVHQELYTKILQYI